MKTLIVNANIIPMTDQNLILDSMSIEIQKGQILAIEPMKRKKRLQDSQLIDLGGKFLLPGLIDLHVHSVEEPYTELARGRTISDDNWTVIRDRVRRNLQEALLAGITSIFDCGAPYDYGFRIRKEISKNPSTKPRFFFCGPLLTSPGNHGAPWGREITGDELPQVIQVLSKENVEFIKIINDPIAYTFEELQNAVVTSHQYGKKVAYHAFTEEAIWMGIMAGCDSIEHGVACSTEMLSDLRKRKIAIVPTYVTALKSCEDIDRSLITEEELNLYFNPWRELLEKNLPTCLQDDEILVGAGSDAGFPPLHFASLIDEIKLFVKLGASPYRALASATSIASKIRGLNEKLGTIEKGKYADFIATVHNPLNDIDSLSNIAFIMKDGHIVKYDS